MRPSSRQARVLRAIHFLPDASEKSIAKQLKMKVHSVRYEIMNAKADQLLRRAESVNFFRVGLRQYQCYGSLAASGPETIAALKKIASAHPSVAWFGELGGRFQCGLSICARDEVEFYAVFDGLFSKLSVGLSRRQIALTTHFEMYPKKYLDPTNTQREKLALHYSSDTVTLDALDLTILCAVTDIKFSSVAETARALQIARSTLSERISRLYQRHVLEKPIYLINARKFGMQTIKLLLFMAHDNHALFNKLMHYCTNHLHVVNVVRTLGAWEYELTLEVEQTKSIQQVVWELERLLGSGLKEIEILQVFDQLRSVAFLTSIKEIERS